MITSSTHADLKRYASRYWGSRLSTEYWRPATLDVEPFHHSADQEKSGATDQAKDSAKLTRLITTGDDSHISVVIPVYNGEKTIVQTIECLLRQSLAPDEIIVVDDGSTDGTRETLRKFDQRITLLTQLNSGPASARNRGVRAAKSAFVAFTDSDCLPE